MADITILQHWILTKFAFPFLLVFFLVYAILEKTKVLGDNKHQVNALVAFVIGLIFVGFAYPKEVVENLILFLTVALVVVFVALLLWGFVTGGEAKISNNKIKALTAGAVIIVTIIAVIWATGTDNEIIDFFFYQSWSKAFWTNVVFVVAIATALALVLRSSSGGN
ncbi:hypothetical protein J4407_02285 [Candidatus Pacearchaeota archaeon]|nr:hypothetical protein [Candidatus Pacearchaeota archaeon]